MPQRIFRVHASDFLASQAVVSVLNTGHNRRIKQSTLDFYRAKWRNFNSKKRCGGEILFLVGIVDNEPISISTCAIPRTDENIWHSITVVHPNFRHSGFGTEILKEKIRCLDRFYPKHNHMAFVSQTNDNSIKMCLSAGLDIIGEGTREREDREPTKFFIFSRK